LLVLAMALGSVLMWLGAPIGTIWFAAHTLSSVGSPTLAPLLLVLIVLPVVMVVIASVLRTLDHKFSQVTGYDPNVRRIPTPWNRSFSDKTRRRTTILDVVMVISVIGAGIVAALLWLLVKP
jgi:small-conductance mechanosensitive channel